MHRFIRVLAPSFAVLILALMVSGSAQAAGHNDPNLSSAQLQAQLKLNNPIVAFCAAHMNQKVGSGQCTALAEAALQAAGCKTSTDLGVTGLDADYVWGTRIFKFKNIMAGDIIQFRNVTTSTTTKNGNSTSTSSHSFPHHTAVVASSDGIGHLTVYEQNVNGEQFVHLNVLNLGDRTGGTTWIFHPVKK